MDLIFYIYQQCILIPLVYYFSDVCLKMLMHYFPTCQFVKHLVAAAA